jgi:hypothetical protein
MLVIASLFNLTVKEMPVMVTIKKRFKFRDSNNGYRRRSYWL